MAYFLIFVQKTVLNTIMKIHQLLPLSAFLFFNCTGIETTETLDAPLSLFDESTNEERIDALKLTADEFIAAASKPAETEAEYIALLKPYFDPAISNRDSLCADYYFHWRGNYDQNSFSIKSSVNTINLIGADSAEVIIDDLWRSAEGDTSEFHALTRWVRKDGEWYRTIEASYLVEAVLFEDDEAAHDHVHE